MKKNQYDKEQPRRRFSEKTDGEMVRKYFAEMPTSELARMLGLEPRQVSDFAHRKNYEGCLKTRRSGSMWRAKTARKGDGRARNRKNKKLIRFLFGRIFVNLQTEASGGNFELVLKLRRVSTETPKS